MSERKDETREQHEGGEAAGAARSGYPEETLGGEGGETGASGREAERGTEPTDSPDSRSGSAGEGTQSTGNPDAAG